MAQTSIRQLYCLYIIWIKRLACAPLSCIWPHPRLVLSQGNEKLVVIFSVSDVFSCSPYSPWFILHIKERKIACASCPHVGLRVIRVLHKNLLKLANRATGQLLMSNPDVLHMKGSRFFFLIAIYCKHNGHVECLSLIEAMVWFHNFHLLCNLQSKRSQLLLNPCCSCDIVFLQPVEDGTFNI